MQYLLGQARAEEVSSFEERLITDKAFYDELTIAEDELIDQYLDGELTELERVQFESHFLFSPERQQKFRFGRALLFAAGNSNDSQPVEFIEAPARSLSKPPLTSGFPLHMLRSNTVWPYAVIVLLVAAGIGFWVVWSLNQTNVRVPGKTATITLLPGTTRADGSTSNRISNTADTETIRLRLARANPQDNRVKVVNSAEREVWSGEGVSQTDSGHNFIVVNVPAKSLPNGDYKVLLSRKLTDGSFEEVLSYSLSVVP